MKVVLLLETNEHATEVVADEILKQRVNSVAVFLSELFKDFVGEIGTGFEGQTLRLDKSVVAVEEDILDLERNNSQQRRSIIVVTQNATHAVETIPIAGVLHGATRGSTYLRHLGDCFLSNLLL